MKGALFQTMTAKYLRLLSITLFWLLSSLTITAAAAPQMPASAPASVGEAPAAPSYDLPEDKVKDLLKQQRYLERQIAVRQKNANERKDASAQQYNIGYDDGYNKALLDLLKSQLLNGIHLPAATPSANSGNVPPPVFPSLSQRNTQNQSEEDDSSASTSSPAMLSSGATNAVSPQSPAAQPLAPTQNHLARQPSTTAMPSATTPSLLAPATAAVGASAAVAASAPRSLATEPAGTVAPSNSNRVFPAKSVPIQNAQNENPAPLNAATAATANTTAVNPSAPPSSKPVNQFDQYMSLSTQSLQNKQWQQAADYASRAISIKNDVAESYINRSWALAELGDTRQALVDANLSIQLAPNMGLAYNNRAYTYELMDNLPEARNDYQRACQHGFRVACTVLPKIDGVLAQRVMSKKEKIKELERQSEELVRVRNWPQVIDVASKMINIDANYASAYINRSWARAESGQLEASLADAGKAIIINPKDPIAYNNRAYTYELMNDLSSARRDYAKACELKLASACNVVQKIDDLGRKNTPAKKVAQQTPPQNKQEKIQQLITSSFEKFRQGNWNAVEQLSNKILKIDPNNALAYVNRAGARTEMGLVYNALDDIERAIKLNPKLGIAYNNKGYTLERMGDKKKAVIQYQKACQLGLQQSCKDFKRLMHTD